jgi:hypothetical protein
MGKRKFCTCVAKYKQNKKRVLEKQDEFFKTRLLKDETNE